MQEQTRTELDGAGLAGGPSGLYFRILEKKLVIGTFAITWFCGPTLLIGFLSRKPQMS